MGANKWDASAEWSAWTCKLLVAVLWIATIACTMFVLYYANDFRTGLASEDQATAVEVTEAMNTVFHYVFSPFITAVAAFIAMNGLSLRRAQRERINQWAAMVIIAVNLGICAFIGYGVYRAVARESYIAVLPAGVPGDPRPRDRSLPVRIQRLSSVIPFFIPLGIGATFFRTREDDETPPAGG